MTPVPSPQASLFDNPVQVDPFDRTGVRRASGGRDAIRSV